MTISSSNPELLVNIRIIKRGVIAPIVPFDLHSGAEAVFLDVVDMTMGPGPVALASYLEPLPVGRLIKGSAEFVLLPFPAGTIVRQARNRGHGARVDPDAPLAVGRPGVLDRFHFYYVRFRHQ
ncbi:MAG: hypothetical protein P8X82_04615 [Gemmatimonadales bacterium]